MKNTRFLIGKKYLAACAIAFMLGGKLSAQSNTQLDSIKPLNHTDSVTLAPHEKSKQPRLVFENPDEAFRAEFKAFANMSPSNTKPIFAPLFMEQSFIRIDNKVTVGEKTTDMLQNRTTKNMSPIVIDMYTYVDLDTKFGKFYTKFGKFSELDYSPEFAQYMPVSFQFINMIDLAAGHYFPSATVIGFQRKNTRVSVGYAENVRKFKFTGNGGVMVSMEQKFNKNLKMGGTVFLSEKSASGEFQLMYTMPNHDIVLFQALDIGTRPAAYLGYKHDLSDQIATIALNGFYQSGDGMAGGSISMAHQKSGVYVSAGAIYHDPLRKPTPNDTQDQGYNKLLPFCEFGINKIICPWGK